MPAGFVQTYRAFAYNNAWANYRLLTACSNLNQEEFEAARTGFFPSLQMTLNHIYVVDLFYVDALSRRSNDAAKRHASVGRSSSGSSPASFRQSGRYTLCHVTASTPKPEGGARCVSSARRDLCGGREVTRVPCTLPTA
jgi:hypothetical protein